MKYDPSFDFSVNKEKNTISIKREFDAPQSIIWDAYTTREILDQWWAPKPWKANTKTMDFRNGGHWLYAMVGPAGEEQWSIENYSDIQPQKKFIGHDGFTDSAGNINKDMPQSKWEVSFSDKAGKTLVEINISYDTAQQLEDTLKMGFKDGLAMGMENLDALLPELKKDHVLMDSK